LPWGASATLDGIYSHGLGGRDGSATVPLSQQGASPVFDKLNIAASLRQPLPETFELDFYAHAQTSFGSSLMLAEQFSLDGPEALSSFAAGTFSVDQGLGLRAEVTRPFSVALVEFAPPVTLAPYVYGAFGHGGIVNPTAAQKSSINAGSAGFGLRSTEGTTIAGWWPLGGSLAVEFGRQFSNVPGARDGYRTLLAVNVTF
jgi:hemolysin activation/secretion protein